MKALHQLPLFLAAWTGLSIALQSAEPEADPKDLPRIPVTEPKDAAATIEVRPGFNVELAAAEPLVMDPIDIEFDEHGRLFVVEMRGYSERREDKAGRIKLLVDKDDDGFFDSATVYAEGLKWPTSVCCYDGGIFVVASPDIFYFKDTDGDGVSDTQELVFTGFGIDREHRLNMQALVNSLKWGPDNRIWGATASNGGRVRKPDQPESEAINLNGSDFSFDPKMRDLRPENGTAQFGMSFDSLGRRFVCSNSNHIQWIAWERGWVKPNPYFTMPTARLSIATDGAAAPVFRISPDEPWRIVRTRWRVAGAARGPVEGGGRVSGYFTAATGITLYTGDVYGADFKDNAFIGDAGSNLVHRKILDQPEGRIQPVAERPEDEKGTEFLRSKDNWFRPVNFANGPDGCLYICDMYRETIEHPWSIPEGIKKHVDLDSGNDRGRIWRVVPDGFKRPAFSIERDSGWQNVTRQRLGYEAGKPYRISHPEKIVETSHPSDSWGAAFTLVQLDTAQKMIEEWNGSNPTLRSRLAEMIGKTGDLKAIQTVINGIAEAGISPESEATLTALGNGLRSAKLNLAKADPENRLGALFAAARETAGDAAASTQDRSSALKLLAFDRDEASTKSVRQVIANAENPDTARAAAIAALGSQSDVGELLIKNWSGFSATLKSAALTALTARPDRATALLEAIRSGAIPKIDIPANTATLLRGHKDAKVKTLAAAVIPAPKVVPRTAIVAKYQAALKLKGDAKRGAAVYLKGTCFTCHKSPDGQGFVVGPDLATFKTAGGDSIIKNLFDPNAEVAPQYQAYTFSMTNGEAIIGVIANEDQTNVTVRMQGGIEKTFPRKEVAGMRGLGQSLMPQGLEAALTEQDVADLLAYIASVE